MVAIKEVWESEFSPNTIQKNSKIIQDIFKDKGKQIVPLLEVIDEKPFRYFVFPLAETTL